jgi:hypothetical protein
VILNVNHLEIINFIYRVLLYSISRFREKFHVLITIKLEININRVF